MNLYGAISFDSAATRVAIIDVDGTNTSVGVIDDPGREFLHAKFPTRPRESAAEFATRLAGVMHELVGKLASGATRRVIGIASPAANGLRGTIESPANLGWGTVNIMELVRQLFTLPVAVSNDADARPIRGMRWLNTKGECRQPPHRRIEIPEPTSACNSMAGSL